MNDSVILPRSTPEGQGLPTAAIGNFIEAAEQHLELHSMLLLRHGQVVAEAWWAPYSADRFHLLYSLSKAFTSTAVGLAIEEGRLSVDDAVLSFFPDKVPAAVSDHLAAMKVHHLLTMSTGHVEDAYDRAMQQGDGDTVAGFFAVPPDRAPGSVFTYNNAATFMLSAIVQELTGEKLVEYLQPRLFEPLGIDQTYWYENAQGINQGFSGLHLTTEAIARFGLLYLQQGQWQGRPLVPEQWVATATAKHIDTNPPPEDGTPDWARGYGYQFWQCPHGAYRGDGAFGQICLVMPEQNAVLATTAAVDNMQSLLDLVWAHLLPAMEDGALADDAAAQGELSRRIEGLSIEPTKGAATAELAAAISGKDCDFSADPNAEDDEILTLHFGAEQVELVERGNSGEHRVRAGYNQWLAGTTTFFESEEVPVVSSAAWTAPEVFALEIRYLQTPHSLTLEFHFNGEEVRLESRWNVMFGSTEMPPLKGRLIASEI